MVLTFRELHNRFFIEILQYTPLTFFKEVFTDTLCVERYADPKLDCNNWTVLLGCTNWTVETRLKNWTVKTGLKNWTVKTGLKNWTVETGL